MEYYHSTNPNEQLNEAMENLKKQLLKEAYGNFEVQNNIQVIHRNTLKIGLKKADLYGRLVSSSEYAYSISKLARENARRRAKNDAIINKNVRMQIAEDIVTRPGISTEVAVLALEVLLRKPDVIPQSNVMYGESFDAGIKQTRIGIRKLRKINQNVYGTLEREERQVIEEFKRSI